MAFFDTTWYCNAGDQATTGYYAVPKRAQNAVVVAGQIVRQFTAPAVGSERCFICTIPGTTANATDAWNITRASVTTDGTVTWLECTGMSAVNGDLTNTPNWNTPGFVGATISRGVIVKRISGTSYQIFTTASGVAGASEPVFSDTPGTNVGGWVCIGLVGAFTGGQAPFARLASACASTWFAASNTIYVGDNHAESQATTITITPTIAINPFSKILCHNHSGSYPPASSDLTTGATISTTVGVAINISPTGGPLYIYGLTFKSGIGSVGVSNVNLTGASFWLVLDNCSLQLASTGSGVIVIGASAGTIIFNNTTVKFGVANQAVTLASADFTWQNTGPVLVSGSVVPTSLLIPNVNGVRSTAILEALDLSQITGNIFSPAATYLAGTVTIKDCKFNAAGAIVNPTSYGGTVQLVRSSA